MIYSHLSSDQMQTQGEICVPDNEAVGLLSLPESHYISAIQLSSTQSWLLPLILLASQHKSTGADCSRQAVFRTEKSLKSHKVKCHPRIGAARPAHVFTILHCLGTVLTCALAFSMRQHWRTAQKVRPPCPSRTNSQLC